MCPRAYIQIRVGNSEVGFDTLSSIEAVVGGEGNDLFVFLGMDISKLGGSSLGTDIIADFQVGDVVDLSDVSATRKATYSLLDNGQDTTLVAQFKGMTVEIAVLEDFSGHSLEDMIAQGMLLV